MHYSLSYLILAVLCVLQVDAAPSLRNRGSNSVGKGDLAPSPSLKQTTWKEINDRQVSRTNPNYKRQMASAVPFVYPTCSVANPGSISVARYTQVELIGTDILPINQYLSVGTEMECLRQCTSRSNCVGYFYRPDLGRCWIKSGWTATSFILTSVAARAPGSVTGLLGTCAASATQGTPSAANNVCCDARMAAGLTYPTCDAFPVGGTSLARYEAVELNEGDSIVGRGPFTANFEEECLGICQSISDCIGYFFRSDLSQCYPKASFQPPAKFVLSGWAADAPGAAVGILGGCNDVAFSGAPGIPNDLCCEARMDPVFAV